MVACVAAAVLSVGGAAVAGFTAPVVVEVAVPPVDRSCTWTATGCVVPPPRGAIEDVVDGWRGVVGDGADRARGLPKAVVDQPFRGPATVVEGVAPTGIGLLRGANDLTDALLDDLRDRLDASGDLLDGLLADPTGLEDELAGTPVGVLLRVVTVLLLDVAADADPELPSPEAPATEAPAPPSPEDVVAALLAVEPDPALVLAALERLLGDGTDASTCTRLRDAAAAADADVPSEDAPGGLTPAIVADLLGCAIAPAPADAVTGAGRGALPGVPS